MYKTKEAHTDTFQPLIIIEVPISTDVMQDCYSYYAMDAPSELKGMILKQVSNTIDDIILNHKLGEGSNKEWLKNKLATVKITY